VEHSLFALPWHEMLLPSVSWAEKIVRPCIVYLALMFAFRFMSKRDLTESTTFDLLIVLLLSNIVQNALIGADNSILGGLVGAGALLLVSTWLNRLTGHNTKARKVLEGEPILLVYNGRPLEDNLRKYAVSRPDLNAGLRAQNVISMSDVRYAFLELDGTISVIRKADQPGHADCLPPELASEYQN